MRVVSPTRRQVARTQQSRARRGAFLLRRDENTRSLRILRPRPLKAFIVIDAPASQPQRFPDRRDRARSKSFLSPLHPPNKPSALKTPTTRWAASSASCWAASACIAAGETPPA
jgi:hypothetical protein